MFQKSFKDTFLAAALIVWAGGIVGIGMTPAQAEMAESAPEVVTEWLAPALQWPDGQEPRMLSPQGLVAPAEGLLVNNWDWEDVAEFYDLVYLASDGLTVSWSGNMLQCRAGETSLLYEDATILRVNYYRAMAGLPAGVILNEAKNIKCQEAALMMIAQGSLSHTPGDNWACYTPEGAEAAGKSNLAIGSSGPASIDRFMRDEGSGNTAVGHRRWILYPPQVEMGTGSTDGSNGFFHGSNCLWVIGDFGSRPSTENGVAWPPPGYVPYKVVFPRWSFSFIGGDFQSATVNVFDEGGQALAVSVLPIQNGFGDNTIVWEASGLILSRPFPSRAYRVVISGVKVGGVEREFEYDVVLIDPEAPAPPQPTLWPPLPTPTPTVGPEPTPTPSPTEPTPEDYDSDGDGKPDVCETSDPLLLADPAAGWTHLWLPDSDGDGLNDRAEAGDCYLLDGLMGTTDPRNPDTDGDGFSDGIEVLMLGTNPLDASDPDPSDPQFMDSDGDGIPDGQDDDNQSVDSDGDHYADGYEWIVGSDPGDPNSVPRLGDVNDDGGANNLDAIILFNWTLRNVPDFPGLAYGDMNRDGLLNNVDAIVLFNWTLSNIPYLPID